MTILKCGPMRVSMNGEDLGEVEKKEVVRMFSDGTLDRTAHYWMEGMPEWRPITEVIVEADSVQPEAVINSPSPRTKKSLTKAQITFLNKRGIPYEGLQRPQVEALISETKAAEEQEKLCRRAESEARLAEERRLSLLPTPKQLAYLDYHRVQYDDSLTKQDARELIDATIKNYSDSKWNRVKHIVRPDLYEFEESEEYYKKQVDESQQQLAELKASESAAPEDIEDAKETLYDAKQQLEEYKETLSYTIDEWDDRFTQHEDTDMEEEVVPFMQVFKKPSKAQIRKILDRFEKHYRLPLDSISIEEFFFVYQKLFPDCFKKGRSASFNVDDIIIENFYEKSEKERRDGPTRAASVQQAINNKSGAKIVRGVLIAIGILLVLAFISVLLR